jgi:hypothetical protein
MRRRQQEQWKVTLYPAHDGQDGIKEELTELLKDPKDKLAAVRTKTWLEAVAEGDTSPESELETHSRKAPDQPLWYRCHDEVVVIFELRQAGREMRVLRVCKAASAHPKVADIDMAAKRAGTWP